MKQLSVNNANRNDIVECLGVSGMRFNPNARECFVSEISAMIHFCYIHGEVASTILICAKMGEWCWYTIDGNQPK